MTHQHKCLTDANRVNLLSPVRTNSELHWFYFEGQCVSFPVCLFLCGVSDGAAAAAAGWSLGADSCHGKDTDRFTVSHTDK